MTVGLAGYRDTVLSQAVTDMRFRDGRYKLNNVQGSFPAGFVRASAANDILPSDTGLLTPFAVDMPRLRSGDGLLMETSATNLTIYSNNLANAAWSKTLNVAPNSAIGIDGALSAWLCTATLTNSSIRSGAATVAASTPITCSIYAKRGNCDYLRMIGADSGQVNGISAWFNLATGVVGSVVQRGTASGLVARIIPAGNGWYRCIVTYTSADTNSSIYLQHVRANGSGTVDVGDTVYLQCAQTEAGSEATSYIATDATAVTRAADLLNFTLPALGINSTAGAMFLSWSMMNRPGVVNSIATLRTVSGSDNRISLLNSAAGVLTFNVSSGGAAQVNLMRSLANNVRAVLGYTWGPSNSLAMISGDASPTPAGIAPVGLTQVILAANALAGAAPANSRNERWAFHSRQLSSSELVRAMAEMAA